MSSWTNCNSHTDWREQPRVRRMRTVWLKLLLDPETAGSEVEKLSVATPLLPRIKKAGESLRTVITLNRNVHIAHYNRIIAEAALRVRAGG